MNPIEDNLKILSDIKREIMTLISKYGGSYSGGKVTSSFLEIVKAEEDMLSK